MLANKNQVDDKLTSWEHKKVFIRSEVNKVHDNSTSDYNSNWHAHGSGIVTVCH